MRRRSAAGLVAIAALAGGCGPTTQEVGQAVLWAAPFITLAALGLAWCFARLWQPLVAGLRLDARPGLIVVVVQLAIALVTLIEPHIDVDLIPSAIWAVGATQLLGSLVAIRVAVRLGSRAYAWAYLAPWLVLYPPAIALAVYGDDVGSLVDLVIALWIFPGYLGMVTAPVGVAALIEVIVRRSRVRRPPPVVVPEARARHRRRAAPE